MRWHLTGFLSCCKDNSSILYCVARSVSSQQILLNSANLLHDFLGRAYVSNPISIQIDFVSLSLIRPSIWLMQMKSLRFNFLIDLQKSIILILYVSSQFQLQFRTVFCWATLSSWGHFLFKDFLEILSVPQGLHDVSVSISPFFECQLKMNWNNRTSIIIRTNCLYVRTTVNHLRSLFPKTHTQRSWHGGNSASCGLLAVGCSRARKFWIFGSWDNGGSQNWKLPGRSACAPRSGNWSWALNLWFGSW